MGLLDSIFGGGTQDDAKSGGGPSGITMALLALLAYRTYQGKGRLADMLGTNKGAGAAPDTDPAGRSASPGRLPDGNAAAPSASGGGLSDILGGLLGGRAGTPAGGQGGGLGDLLRGGLGGLLGGAAAGSALNGGLGDLLKRFQDSGKGDIANSWVSGGQNRQVSPEDVEHALGRDTVQELADNTGKPYLDVLSDLSRGLPETVDKLTPQGRMPTEDEAKHW
jgi:uncharacterized protein YidB (DUF937 family)